MPLSPRLKYSPNPEIALDVSQLAARDKVQRAIKDGTLELKELPCFCGEHQAITIAERDRYGLPVTTVLCMNCGLLRTSPQMSLESTNRFYKENYRELYSSHLKKEDIFENEVKKGRGLSSRISNFLSKLETVYDIGCGTGGMLYSLKELGKTVAGCDVDEDYLEVGRAKGLDLIQGNVQELLLQKGKQADLVLLSHVVEHFLDLPQELTQAIEAVRPGGFLLIEVPGIRNTESFFGTNLLIALQNAHTYYFTGQTLHYVLSSVGLDVVISDEIGLALAKRPENWTPGTRPIAPPFGEALSVLSFLAEFELKYLKERNSRKIDKLTVSPQSDPWPLATNASLRVLAWPQYNNLESLTRMLTIAEPLYDVEDACLCIRYDHTVDIPYDQAVSQLQKAFEIIDKNGNLDVLIIDDLIPETDWPRLGQAVTCALQADIETDETHAAFIKSLGIEVIAAG